MPYPLTFSRSKLDNHFQKTGKILTDAVDNANQLQIETTPTPFKLIGNLQGSGCEPISRNSGPDVFVAPMLRFRLEFWVWLGYHEEWIKERRDRYSFSSVGISIYYGFQCDNFKPQMFRAEWDDSAEHNAQPHWHFDALDSVSDDDSSQRAEELRQLLLENKSKTEPDEFVPQVEKEDVRNLVTAQKLSGIHFASAAPWWKSPPNDKHVHRPSSLGDIEKWVQKSLNYIKGELKRL